MDTGPESNHLVPVPYPIDRENSIQIRSQNLGDLVHERARIHARIHSFHVQAA